jgi:hypothetical protein
MTPKLYKRRTLTSKIKVCKKKNAKMQKGRARKIDKKHVGKFENIDQKKL